MVELVSLVSVEFLLILKNNINNIDNKYLSISMNINKYLLLSLISSIIFFSLAGGAGAAEYYVDWDAGIDSFS